jgi:PKD repeat protein
MSRSSACLLGLLMLLTAISAVASCDDDDDHNDDASPDDDDNDSSPDDDDDDNNDDASPDDDDNDSSPDDDDDDDDDDDNDDDSSFDGEPVAVLTASLRFADVGQSVAFAGEDSYDPDGDTLTYHYDFGDGGTAETMNAAHSFAAPGAYRVVLTVTNETAQSDASAAIVSVGDFPTGVGALDALDRRPNYFDPVIHERIAEPAHGGLIFGFFVSPADAVADTILINGAAYTPDREDLTWCEVVPRQLTAGGVGIVRCDSEDADFDANQPVTIEVREGATVLWQKTGTLPPARLTPSTITASVDDSELLVHARNDSGDPLTVDGLSINGLDVSDFVVIENPALAPGETAIIRAPMRDGVVLHEWTVFTVHGSDGQAAFQVSRALRLYEPLFLVGNWNSDNVWDNLDNLQRNLAAGINLLIWSPNPDQPPEEVLGWADEYDFYVFTHRGDFSGDQYFIDFVDAYGDNPRVFMNAVKGEGDDEPPPDALAEVQAHRDLWGPNKRLWIYNNCSNYFSRWGAMADVGGMDHYCVWAAKCNTNWPPFYWDEITMAGRYTEVIRRAAEPNPIYTWTQSAWNDFDINGSQVRWTTPDEIRAQWYQVLGYGSKTILWFLFRQEQWDGAPDSEQEMIALTQELRTFEDIILEGDASIRGAAYAQVDDEQIDVTTTTSPRGMVITLNNLDYDLNLILPWVWHAKADVLVTVTPPDGFEPGEFLHVHGNEQTPLDWEKTGANQWQVILPSLVSAEAILVIPDP